MTLYTLALFLHICGALALGAIDALLLIGLMGLRRAAPMSKRRGCGVAWPSERAA